MRSTLFFLSAVMLAGNALAQAPQLPPPDAVSLDKLGYMSSFPPAEGQLVDQGNRTQYPQMRWVLQHTRELMPTRNIRRGCAPVSKLPTATRDLDGLVFQDDKGRDITVVEWLTRTYTDAIVVMHRGRIVYERHMNQMRPETPHLLFSLTKSFTGLLADSAWGDMKLRDVTDMTGAVPYREVYTDPSTEVFPYLYASTMLPRLPATPARATSTTF